MNKLRNIKNVVEFFLSFAIMFLSSHRETTFTVRIIMTGCFFGCRVIIRIKKRIICLNKRKEQRKRVKNEMRKIATLCMMNAHGFLSNLPRLR